MKKINFFSLLIMSLLLLVNVNAAIVSHPASEITAGTFDAGDFTFQGNVEQRKSGEVFLNLNNIEASGRQWALVSAGSVGGIGVGKFSIYDRTSSVSRLAIDANGNVGIGTTSPTQRLDVAGYVKGQSGLCIGNDCKTSWPIVTGGGYWDLSGSNIYNTNTGNVGIGTTNPLVKLHVVGVSWLTDSTQTYNSHFPWTDNNAYVSGERVYLRAGGNRGFAITLTADNTNGNVGIGTTSPAYRLDVAGDVRGTRLCIGTDCRNVWPTGIGGGITSINSQTGPAITLSAGSGVSISTIATNNIQITASGVAGVSSINGVAGALTFQGSGVSQSGNTFTFSGVGGGIVLNQGGGISLSPNPITTTGTISLATQNCPSGQFVTGIGGAISCAIPPSGPGGGGYWALFGSNIYNTNSGNVGIGTTNPDAKLRIVGGGIRIDAGQIISAPGRLHIQAENENLYLNPWSGTTYVGYGGGPGNLNAAGDVRGTRLCIGTDCRNAWPTVTGGGYWDLSGSNIYNTNSGNVGIGTSAPTQKLQVEGNIRLWYDLVFSHFGQQWTGLRDDGSTNLYLVPWSRQYTNVVVGANSAVNLNVNGNTYTRDVWLSAPNSGSPRWASQGSTPTPTVITVSNIQSFSNNADITAYCPAGYVRTGCSGGTIRWGVGSNDDNEAHIVQPVGDNGCRLVSEAGTENQVYAYCLKY